MADSIGSSSLHPSSDQDVDPCCEPCDRKGRLLEPVGYCPKCIEFFCQSCLDAHSRLGIIARHKIQTGDDMPKSIADKPVKYQFCDTHDGESKNRFCFDHRIIVCRVCSFTKHKDCEVELVTEAHRRFNISAEKKTLCHDVVVLINYANTVKKSVGKNINKLETDSRRFLQEAEAHRDKLIKQIDESYQKFSTDLRNEVKEQTKLLSPSQFALDQIISDLTPTLQSLHQIGTKKQNDPKQFLDLQSHAETVRLCLDKNKNLDISTIYLEYNLNKAIQPLLGFISKLGEFSIQSKPFECETTFPDTKYLYPRSSRYTDGEIAEQSGKVSECREISAILTSWGKIDVKIEDDIKDCLIGGIDVTVDGKILLADLTNSKIKLFSPAGRLVSALKLPDAPLDVTIINRSEAAAIMNNQQIRIINIADKGSLSLKRTLQPEFDVCGNAALNNNLVITSTAAAADNADHDDDYDVDDADHDDDDDNHYYDVDNVYDDDHGDDDNGYQEEEDLYDQDHDHDPYDHNNDDDDINDYYHDDDDDGDKNDYSHDDDDQDGEDFDDQNYDDPGDNDDYDYDDYDNNDDDVSDYYDDHDYGDDDLNDYAHDDDQDYHDNNYNDYDVDYDYDDDHHHHHNYGYQEDEDLYDHDPYNDDDDVNDYYLDHDDDNDELDDHVYDDPGDYDDYDNDDDDIYDYYDDDNDHDDHD